MNELLSTLVNEKNNNNETTETENIPDIYIEIFNGLPVGKPIRRIHVIN